MPKISKPGETTNKHKGCRWLRGEEELGVTPIGYKIIPPSSTFS